MKRGFTLVEVMIATILLGLGATAILLSMSQSHKTMVYSTYFQTAQEVMDLGDMAYPLEDVKDDRDLDVSETKATELWDLLSNERLTNAQEERYHGYTWERECVNRNDDEEIERLGGLYVVKVTVRWGDRFRGRGDSESYTTFWRKPQ